MTKISGRNETLFTEKNKEISNEMDESRPQNVFFHS